MTVSSQTSSVSYLGDGVTTLLPVPYYFLEQTDLVVTRVNTDTSVQTLVLGSDYSVSGAGVQAGGAVTMLSPPLSGVQIIINRVVPVTQETDYVANDPFPAESHEMALDKLTMLVQQAFSYLSRALLRPVGKNDYDAEGRKIVNLGDGSADPDAVNIRTMRSYVDNAIAGVVGGFGYFIQAGTSAILRTFQSKMRDEFNVMDFGAVGSTATLASRYATLAAAQVDYPFVTSLADTIDYAAFRASYLAAQAQGGKKINIPAGTFYAYEILFDTKIYWEGAGVDATTLTQPIGYNRDIFISRGFASFTGVGPLRNAPIGFGAKKLTVDGNYLADYRLAAAGGDTTVNNTAGYGMKIFGSKYHIDCEIVNCAQVGFYSEAVDYTSFGDEANSYLRIAGRVFGKEAVIYRGPADCNLEHVIMGAVAWQPTQALRNSVLSTSDVYPGDQVHVMVTDEELTGVGALRYNGHHEFGIMHLYGNLSGLGYKTREMGRLKGNHMVVENCRGGAYFDSRVWGNISILEAHNNGREPSTLAGTLPVFPDVEVASLQGLTLDITVRRIITQAATYLGLKATGRMHNIKLNYFTIAPAPANSPVANIQSENATYDIVCTDVSGDAVLVEGVGNKVKVNGRSIASGALVRRIAGGTSANRGNELDITARDCAAVLNLDGLVTTETIKVTAELLAGQVVNSGSALDFTNRTPAVSISARIGAVSVSSQRSGRINLDNTIITEQTITITHGYFQTPDPAQVSLSIYDPTPSYVGALEYARIQSVSATQVVFVYKLSAIGAGGPLVLCWKVGN